MIIRSIEIEKFRSFEHASFALGKRITAISGRNATQKTTVLGMLGQPFTISNNHHMYGCKTIDGYNFRSQFQEKFKISPHHDIIGEHKWKLELHNNVHTQNYYKVQSIPRLQRGQDPKLRFWNAESRASGAGYIQLPVYFLSLSRLFPIGESGGKTQAIPLDLTQEELQYCITNYRTILSIQNMPGEPSIGLAKGSSKTFSGVSDGIHDIFANSAGEGNVTRIILAILSFKRLKEQYARDYKGGILLIDELDATLYGFSQRKLVEYLWKSASEYKIQIIFTTHSPVILKQVNKYQRKEHQQQGINLPLFAYDSAIVYLEPQYNGEGKRTIMPKNISSASDLNTVLNDINLVGPSASSKLNIYCEDARAVSFTQFVLANNLEVNYAQYMNFVDINLGWTNYVQLYEKGVPEFKNNIILLDGDVPHKSEYRPKERLVNNAQNFLFLPLVIEKDIFNTLKNHDAFNRFSQTSSNLPYFTYDVCFNEWPLDTNCYDTLAFKNWFAQTEVLLGDQNLLYTFWCQENPETVDSFVESFIRAFNSLAERGEVDALPPPNITPVRSDDNPFNPEDNPCTTN